ncbi:MAG: hypothetical protein KJ985_10380 [Proteobacteria bacterium]|nr:hypothetical protein [Pseudomonadota bacterium]
MNKHHMAHRVKIPAYVYSPGEYRCYFTINTDASTEEDIARLEVASVAENGDQVVLSQRELKGEKGDKLYKKVYLDFSIAEKAKLEFRVFYYGKGEVRVEQVAVYKAGNDRPLDVLEAAKMVGDTGQLVYEKDASSGRVIEAIAGESKNGELVYGPNRIYSKGQYRARFYLRTKNAGNLNKTDVAAALSVTSEPDVNILSHRNVTVGELNENSFTGVEVEFVLMRDEELSFHVKFTGKVSLQLDGIEIERR